MSKIISLHEPDFTSLEREYVNDCIKSSWVSTTGKYIDKCNIKNQANLYGLNTCEFNHILNTKLNKSEDEDGYWIHLDYYYENNKYLIFMKRSNFIVAIKGNLSSNYDFNGSYYVLNGHTNKMYGNCSII